MKVRPERIRMEDDGKRLTISWRWFEWELFVPFGLIMPCFGAPLLLYGSTLIREPREVLGWSAPVLLFCLLHLAAILALFYRLVLANIFNSTHIQVSPAELIIRHGPLPCLDNHHLSRKELSQLYAQQIPGRGSTYWLMAKTRTGRTLTLIKALDKEQALSLERTLEKRLGIRNRRVGDEDESGVVRE
ncbi:hypothetical protein F0U59_42835 [Archangium gephyra]|nr:hypothetical protein F0U59_42835 [Archangium gephyra]